MMKCDEVQVYSLYEDGYSEVVASSTFRRALLEWREFLQSPPDVSAVREVEAAE